MTPIESAGFWIGLNLLFLIYLSMRVGQIRTLHKVFDGDGQIDEVAKAVRTHGNYIEYAPGALVGLMSLALLGGGAILIHLLGALFLAGRVCHLIGFGLNKWSRGRFVGTLLTMITLLITGAALVVYAVR